MNQIIMTRAQAHVLRRPRFFTGRPCKYGHQCERYVASGGCVECAKRASLAFSGKAPANRPFGTVEVPAQAMHPDDAAAFYAWLDAVNKARGFLPARRPEASLLGLTPWEQTLALERRKSPSIRPSLDAMLEAANNLGIPETYSAGNSRPVDDWSEAPEEIAIRHRAHVAGQKYLTQEQTDAINAARLATGRPAI